MQNLQSYNEGAFANLKSLLPSLSNLEKSTFVGLLILVGVPFEDIPLLAEEGGTFVLMLVNLPPVFAEIISC